VNKEAAERMIRAHLQDQITRDDNSKLIDEEDDLWQENAEEMRNDDIVEEVGGFDQSDTKKKKTKKLHKGSLLPSGTHISWRDEIEKMLK